MRTLEILTGDRKPGEPGQTDVGGLYAYVMLQAYDLSKDHRYLRGGREGGAGLERLPLLHRLPDELDGLGGERLPAAIPGHGGCVLPGAERGAAGELLPSHMLWQSRLGFAKSYPIFLGVPVLHDSPYMAIYECYKSSRASTSTCRWRATTSRRRCACC